MQDVTIRSFSSVAEGSRLRLPDGGYTVGDRLRVTDEVGNSVEALVRYVDAATETAYAEVDPRTMQAAT